jgi:ElaA protein
MHTRAAKLADIEPRTLYRILALRADVFVVEQQCAYADLDGRDLEPGARIVWCEDNGAVAATLRTLIDADKAVRIGRVATAANRRGEGIAGRLIEQVLQSHDGSDFVLDAQAQLEAWYTRFGFVRTGPDFDEDGISHVPMRRSMNAQ